MRDLIPDVADLMHQMLDLIEHPVDDLGEVLNFFAALDRQAPGELSCHDELGRPGELV